MTASPPFCTNCNLRHSMPGRDVCDTCDVALRTPIPAKRLPPAETPPAAAMSRPVEPLPRRLPATRYEPGGYLHFLIRHFRSLRRLRVALAVPPGSSLPAPGTPSFPGGSGGAVSIARPLAAGLQQPIPVALLLPRPSPTNDSNPQPCSAVGAAFNAGRTA